MAGFLTDTETAVTTGFAGTVNMVGASLLATFKPVFIIGFTIWITLIAYETAFGKSEDGFTYIFTKISKIFLIGTIALWGWPEVADLLQGVKDGFVGGGTMSGTLETQLMDPIALLWSELFRWFTASIQASLGWTEVGRLVNTIFLFVLLFLAYLALSIAVAVFGVVALAMFLVANSVFTLLLAVGPFFLLCLAFPFTQRFFETYIGNVMTSILGMGFTFIMLAFVATLFGLVGIQTNVPLAVDEAAVVGGIKSLAVFFASKAALSLLLIYLYFKVFDLAAALGGGLNMGNNMVGGVRSILRDLGRGAGAGGSSSTNTIAQGSGGGGGGAPGAGAVQRSGRANSTFTGMAASAAMSAAGTRGVVPAMLGGATAGAARLGAAGLAGGARLGAAGAAVGATALRATGRAASRVGAYAYNRYSQFAGRGSSH